MKKLLAIVAPAALAIGVCGSLKADDPTTAPSDGQSRGWGSVDASIRYNEFLEQNVRLAKDGDAAGVEAVIYAAAMFHNKEPQAEIDFLTNALQTAKSRPVRREIRLELFEKYRLEGMDDKAIDQLQQLMMDQ